MSGVTFAKTAFLETEACPRLPLSPPSCPVVGEREKGSQHQRHSNCLAKPSPASLEVSLPAVGQLLPLPALQLKGKMFTPPCKYHPPPLTSSPKQNSNRGKPDAPGRGRVEGLVPTNKIHPPHPRRRAGAPLSLLDPPPGAQARCQEWLAARHWAQAGSLCSHRGNSGYACLETRTRCTGGKAAARLVCGLGLCRAVSRPVDVPW